MDATSTPRCPLKTIPSPFVAAAFVSLALIGCSSSDSSPAPAPGGGSTDASTTPATDSAAPVADASTTPDAAPPAADSATPSFKTCTELELQANPIFMNGADISFYNAGVDGGALAYTNNCVRIPKGQTVGWYGPFTAHPLSGNGEPGSPIPSVTSGQASQPVAFPTAGKYSFHCTNHPDSMYGTVEVEP